jgi:hypothetical protein
MNEQIIVIYVILGIIVTGFTFKFTNEKINCSNTAIGILFWPVGVIWFLIWGVRKSLGKYNLRW